MEQFANNCSTLVASGGYTAASGVLNVISTAAPWPQVGNFSIVIYNKNTNALIVTLTVTAVNSVTQFSVTAEGTDANASEGDLVYGTMLTSRVMKNVGLVLLQSLTANNSATLDFNSVFSSLYDEYKIEIINLVPASNNVSVMLRFSSDGGANFDATAAHYAWVGFFICNNAHATQGTDSDTRIILQQSIPNSADWGACCVLTVFNPLSANYTQILSAEGGYSVSNTRSTIQSHSGTHLIHASQNSIRFQMDAGNITSGIIRIYGVAK
jgi:hypothetical protein